MPEAAMPQVRGAGSGGGQGMEGDTSGRVGVEVTRTVTPKDHGLGMKVLHRETKRVKFNGATIVTSEFSNRN
jgi:hypothetical protein